MTTKTTWTLVTRLPGEHRIFRDANGRLALADNSGDTPDTTDDGVLYLDFNWPVQLVTNWRASEEGDRDEHAALYVEIPLVRPDGEQCAARGSLLDGPVLQGLGMRIQIHRDAHNELNRYTWWILHDLTQRAASGALYS